MSRAIYLLLVLALMARILLALLTPLYDDPEVIPYFNDERAHFNYVRYVAQTWWLPEQKSSVQDGFERAEYEYYQAPLYYLLASPYYSLGKRLTPGWELLWVRLVSVLFSMAGLTILYLAARRFFPKGGLPLNLLFLAAFSGVPLRFGALVTNDSLLFALVCLYFALIFHLLTVKCDLRLLIAAALIAAAGLWTKASFILLLPLLPWVLLRRPNGSIWKAAGSLLIPLAAILPWYLRNYSLYGRFIPLEVGSGSADSIVFDSVLARIFTTANYFVRSLVFPYDGLWGGSLDKLVYPFEGLLFLVLIIAGFCYLLKRYKPVFWMFLAAIILSVCAYLNFSARFFQSEARLLMPAFPFILTLLALGAWQITGKKKNRAILLLGFWVLLPWVGAMV